MSEAVAVRTKNSSAAKTLIEGDRRNKFCIVLAKPHIKGMEVIISNASIEVAFIKLLRRDLTTHQEEFEPVGMNNKFYHTVHANREIIVIDNNVKENHLYEYAAMLYYDNGKSIFGSGKRIQRYKKVTSEVKFKIKNPSVSRSGAPDVTFDIVTSKNFTQSDTDLIRTTINNNDASSFFQTSDELDEFKSNISNLLTFTIVRENLTTGAFEKIVDLPIGEKFIDSSFSASTGANNLEIGNKYRYYIYANSLLSNVIFDDVKEEKVDKRTGKEYSVISQKFLNPKTLSIGSLITPEARAKNYPGSIFALGETGSFITFDADLSAAKATLSRGIVNKLSNSENLVSWAVSGNTQSIDHFIVLVSRFGEKIPIDTLHPTVTSGRIEYIDSTMKNLDSIISYSVIPVYSNYNYGAELTIGTVTTVGQRWLSGY